MSKYNARKVEIDGFVFDSKAEARRYSELKLLEKAGRIRRLELQPKFEIKVDEKHIANYFADFRYYDPDFGFVVEDVKGVRTAVYKLKKRLVEAIYGIKITEVV